MGLLLSLFLLVQLSPTGSAQTPFDKGEQIKVLRKAASQYTSAKSLKELYVKTGLWTPVMQSTFEALKIDVNQTPPKIAVNEVDLIAHFKMPDQTIKVQFVNLATGDLKIQGIGFHYETKKTAMDNLSSLYSQLASKPAGSSAGLLELILPFANASGSSNPTAGVTDDILSVNGAARTYVLGYATKLTAKSLMAGAGSGLWPLVTLPFINYGVYKAEAALAPSCAKQIEGLRAILEVERLGLAELMCGEFTPLGQTGIVVRTAPGKTKTIYADFANNEAWTNSDKGNTVGYFFDDLELSEIRYHGGDCISRDDGEVKGWACNDFRGEGPKPKTAAFEAEKKKIEPFRRLLYSINRNRSCYKCHDEINKALATNQYPYGKDGKPLPTQDASGDR